VLSVCSGAFLLAEAGLLEGRRCTTHWQYADELVLRYPDLKVDPDVLYVADDKIMTSAGTAAGIDLCLHLIRREHGSAVANALARRMVVPPHRDGGQAQYVEAPVPRTADAPTLEPLLSSLVTTLDRDHTVESLAARAHMSSRTFARRFRAETGTTPHDWLTAQRVLLARRLLEDTDLGVDAIALRSGFGTAAMLRHHFTKRVGTTPQHYRTTFRTRPA
jgi:transcriptional regulator GlxA family with amidase domain